MQKKLLGFIIIAMVILSLTGCLGNIQTRECLQTFDVRVTSVANCSLSGRNLSTVLSLNTNPGIEFTVRPNYCIGAKADEYVSIYFKVENYPLASIKTIGGTPFIKWTQSENTWYISGDERIDNLGTYIFRLEFDLNPSEEESSEMDIIFYNKDNTWSKNYKLKLWDI